MVDLMVNKQAPRNEDKTILTVLSIFLAAAVAHGLYMLAVFIPINLTPLWAIFTLILILASIGIILAVIGTEKATWLVGLKGLLIVFFTIAVFALSRFFNFLMQIPEGKNATYLIHNYQMAWFEQDTHLKRASKYNEKWEDFLVGNPSESKIKTFAREMAEEEGLDISHWVTS